MNYDFITHAPGSPNPIKGRPCVVYWKCEHGDTRGPTLSSDIDWEHKNTHDCRVVAYRPAVAGVDPAEEDAKIFATCNALNHLAHINPVLSKEAIFRIIKGEGHTAVVNDVFSRVNALDALAYAIATS